MKLSPEARQFLAAVILPIVLALGLVLLLTYVAPTPACAPAIPEAPSVAEIDQPPPARRDRCIILENGGSWNCHPDESLAALEACPLFSKTPCADAARRAVDAIERKRIEAESEGAKELLRINDQVTFEDRQ